MNAVAPNNDRPSGLEEHVYALGNLLLQIGTLRLWRFKGTGAFGFKFRSLNIKRNIDPRRTRATGSSMPPRRLELVTQHRGIHQSAKIFHDRCCHRFDVNFLGTQLAESGVIRDDVAPNLPGYDDNRHRVDERACDARERVGTARTGGNDTRTDTIADAGIRFGGDRTGLFMEVADVANPRAAA